MKKIQPKIFNNGAPNSDDHNQSTLYEIGVTWHDNLTGNEYLHKNDGVWVDIVTDVDNLIRKSISITYNELVALKSTDGLIPLQTYLITDYSTVYTQPESNVLMSGSTEPLLVTALSNNKLSNECYSTLFPQDIIYYDIESNQTMVHGCTKGYIYRRIDTLKNNDIGFDYRNVKFRRWQINVTDVWDSGTTYSKGTTIVYNGAIYTSLIGNNINNITGLSNIWKSFNFYNLSYISPFNNGWNVSNMFYLPTPDANSFMDCYMFSANNYSGDQSSYTNTYNNKLNTNTSNIIYYNNTVFIGNGNDGTIYNNIIGSKFNNNTINYNFNNNTIGSEFNNNTISYGFNYNVIKNNFSYNHIYHEFHYNTIGNKFWYNLTDYNFDNNKIDNDFWSNFFMANFTNNIIGGKSMFNTFGSNFTFNILGNTIQNSKFGNNFINNDFGSIYYGKDLNMYNTTVSTDAIDSTVLYVVDSSKFKPNGTIRVNGNEHTYVDNYYTFLVGISPNITANIGALVEFNYDLSVLSESNNYRKLTTTPSTIKIQWLDQWSDINIIDI